MYIRNIFSLYIYIYIYIYTHIRAIRCDTL